MEALPNVLKNSLKHLQNQCQKKQQLETVVARILPPHIMDHCRIGNVDEQTGQITLLLDNACWLLKCRHLSKTILSALNGQTEQWQRIDWRICPKDKLRAHVQQSDEII